MILAYISEVGRGTERPKVTERCGGRGGELLTCPYRMRAAPDRGWGARVARGRGKLLFIHYLVNDHYPSPRDLTRGHKRRLIRAGVSFRLCLVMCAKRKDKHNKHEILCVSQQNNQRKYDRSYTTK
jgi:hypothetical protein